MASKDDYVPPAVKEKKKTKGGKLGNATVEGSGSNATESAVDASSSAADEWSQEQQVREERFRSVSEAKERLDCGKYIHGGAGVSILS